MRPWIVGAALVIGLLLIGWIEQSPAASLKSYTYKYPYSWRMECGDKIATYYPKGSGMYWKYVLKCLENTQDLVDNKREQEARTDALKNISRRYRWRR